MKIFPKIKEDKLKKIAASLVSRRKVSENRFHWSRSHSVGAPGPPCGGQLTGQLWQGARTVRHPATISWSSRWRLFYYRHPLSQSTTFQWANVNRSTGQLRSRVNGTNRQPYQQLSLKSGLSFLLSPPTVPCGFPATTILLLNGQMSTDQLISRVENQWQKNSYCHSTITCFSMGLDIYSLN